MQVGVLAALIVVVALSGSPATPALGSQFPIGILDAGLWRQTPNEIASLNNCAGCTTLSADDYLWPTLAAQRWSSLDEVRGTYPGFRGRGCTSPINVVMHYGHLAQYELGDTLEMERMLNAASSLGVKVIVVLPGIEHIYSGSTGKYPATLRKYLQRDPPNTTAGATILNKFKSSPTVFGWYIADEPATTGWPPDLGSDNGFHTAAVSATRLRAAYKYFKSLDSGMDRPIFLAQPDYLASASPWGSRPDSVRAWDEVNGGTVAIPDPCHPEAAPLQGWTKDYRGTSDVVMPDNYHGACRGIYGNLTKPVAYVGNEGWIRSLRQFDILNAQGPGGFQPVLEVYFYCDSSATASQVPEWCGPGLATCFSAGTPGCEKFSAADLRFQAYTAIIHGARGTWFQRYGDSLDQCTAEQKICERDTVVSPYCRDNIVPLTNELASMNRFLVPDSGTVVGKRLWPSPASSSGSYPGVSANGDNLQFVLYKTEKEILVVCANVSRATISSCTLDFTASSMSDVFAREMIVSARSAGVVGEVGRTSVPVADGILTDSFDPVSVHVYTFARREVPGDFDDLNAALAGWQPGDVLYVKRSNVGLGEWFGKLQIRGGMSLIGTDAMPVVLDGTGADTTVVVGDLDADVVLSNFRIRNFEHAGVRVSGGVGATGSVTLSGCVIEAPEAPPGYGVWNTDFGVWIDNAECMLIGTDIVGASSGRLIQGVRYSSVGNPTNLTVERCVVRCGITGSELYSGDWGVSAYSEAGSVVLKNNTISGFLNGVSVAVHGAIGVERNVVVGKRVGCGALPCRTGLWVNDYHGGLDASVQSNNVFYFDNNYQTNWGGGGMPAGNLQADPDLNADLTLNINSPCARLGNSARVWIGARPYVSTMRGVLANSIDLPLTDVLNDAIGLPEDLQVPTGKSLILPGGLKVDASGPATPGANYGADGTLSEIVSEGGRFEARYDTALGQGVCFASRLSPQSVTAWGGLVVKNGGKLILNHATIANCSYGIYGADLADSIRVDDCMISRTQNTCISVQNTTAASMLYVKGGTFDLAAPSTAWAGLYGVGCKSIFIDATTVTGRGASGGVPGATYGLKVGAPSSGGSQPDIWEAHVNGVTAGSGLFVESGSASLRGCQVGDCKWGVQLLGSGSPGIIGLSAPGRSAATVLTNCTTGAYINSTGSPNITGGTISAGTSSGIVGLSTAGSASGIYSDLTISGTNTAIKANSAGPDHLFNSTLTGFSLQGVQVSTINGEIVLGGTSGLGNNIYSAVSGVSKYVGTKPPRLGGIPDINAQYNWWGESPAPAAKFGSWVDYSNALTGPLSNARRRVVDLSADVPLKRFFAVHPNPSTNQVVMSFTVPDGLRTPVDLRVFDITGRAVRILLSETLEPGDQEAVWDGRDASGAQAAAGLYFARLRLGLEIHTRKLLRLPR